MTVPHDQPPSLGIDPIGVPVEKLLDLALAGPLQQHPGTGSGDRVQPTGCGCGGIPTRRLFDLAETLRIQIDCRTSHRLRLTLSQVWRILSGPELGLLN